MSDEPSAPEPEELPLGERVLLLPGHFFFIESVAVPEDVDSGEIESFAELSLESVAPFPLEQLNWGFVYRPGASRLLLYAAHAERVRKEGFTDLEKYAWVLPDFAGVLLAAVEGPREIRLASEHSLALIYLDDASTVPSTLETAPREPDETDPDFGPLRKLAPAPPIRADIVDLRPAGVALSERRMPAFHYDSEHDAANPWAEVRPAEGELWRADVRLAAFKEAERNARRLSRYITRGTGWAAALLGLLLLLELVLFGAGRWLDKRQQLADSQNNTVLRIEDQQSLMLKLDQVATNELRPIAMLELANQVRLNLDANVEYDEAVIEGRNRLTVEGKVGSVNEFNTYVERLRQTGSFEVVEEQTATSGGETIFLVEMNYNHRPEAFDETEAADAGAPGADAEEETAVQ